MRRGDIVVIDFEPALGAEADKRRPAIVVSNHGANASAVHLGRGVVAVVPVTTNTSTIHPFQVFLPASATGLRADSKAQAEQVRSVSVERVGARIGSVPTELMVRIDTALRLHLDL